MQPKFVLVYNSIQDKELPYAIYEQARVTRRDDEVIMSKLHSKHHNIDSALNEMMYVSLSSIQLAYSTAEV